MRILASLVVCLSLTTLAGASGLDASVRWLEGDGGCSSSGSEWTSEDGSARNASYEEACSDAFTYAAADVRDDRGEVVSIGFTAESANASRWSSADTYASDGYASTYQSTWSHAQSSSWDRTLAVQTREGSATTSNGCSDASSWRGGWTDTATAYDRTSDGTWSASGESGCARGASAERDGSAYGASVEDGCSWTSVSTQRHAWYDGGDRLYEDASYESASSSRCAVLAKGQAGDEEAYGGYLGGCDHASYERSRTIREGDNVTESNLYRNDASACRYGAAAGGIDGADAFGGYQAASWSDCYDDGNQSECWGSSWQAVGAGLDWEHNPVQPGSWGAWVPIWLP